MQGAFQFDPQGFHGVSDVVRVGPHASTLPPVSTSTKSGPISIRLNLVAEESHVLFAECFSRRITNWSILDCERVGFYAQELLGERVCRFSENISLLLHRVAKVARWFAAGLPIQPYRSLNMSQP